MSGAVARAEIDFDPARFRLCLDGGLPVLKGRDRRGVERWRPIQSKYSFDVGNRRFVLRKRPQGDLPKSAHDVAREYLFIFAPAASAAPVPAPIRLEEDGSVIGTAFYVMERIDERNFHDATLPYVPRAQRRAYYREFAQKLAKLRAVDWQATRLACFVRPRRYLERQVDRWARAWEESGSSDSKVARVTQWRSNMPQENVLGIVRGDFRFTNVIFDSAEPRQARRGRQRQCGLCRRDGSDGRGRSAPRLENH